MTKTIPQNIYRSVIAVLLAVTILAVAVVSGLLVSGYRSGRFGETNENNTAYLSLTEGFTNKLIGSKTAAVEAAGTVSEKLGLQNAQEELQVDSVHTFDGIKYYRMQQYHKGLPVFGRSVVIGADEGGNSVSLNANTISVSDKLDTEPAVDLSTVETAAKKAVLQNTGAKEATVPSLTEEDLCVYNFTSKGTDKLAYNVRVNTEQGSYRVLVDATDASILDFYSLNFTDNATCYDASGNAFTASYNERLNKYILGNEDSNLYIFTLDGKNYYEGAQGTYVASDDAIFGNTEEELRLDYAKATRYYKNLLRIRDYYQSAYGAKGDKYLIGMYNDSYDDGNNSFATDDIVWRSDIMPAGSIVGVISLGTNQNPTSVDLLAHEYMHRIEQNTVGLLYRGESGALMEAYSDIFGELVEAGLKGTSPNWVHNGIRDIKNPTVHGYPVTYKGKYYVTSSDSDNGAVHKNSTVISHAAYLMWNGIDGTSAKRLNTATLANLWMTALQKFTMRETFQQCAKTVYETALSMDLSKAQLSCVAEAFAQAGLPVTNDPHETDTTTTTVSTTSMKDPSIPLPFGADPAGQEPDAVGDHETSTATPETTTIPQETTTLPPEPTEDSVG